MRNVYHHNRHSLVPITIFLSRHTAVHTATHAVHGKACTLEINGMVQP